jgi:hypothetical protein
VSKVLSAPAYPKSMQKKPHKNYIIKPVENIGLGMFATRNLKKCDLVFDERPFFCVPMVLTNDVFDALLTKNLTEMAFFVRGLSEKRLEYMMSRISNADRDAVMQLATHEDTGPLHGQTVTASNG